MEEQLEKFQFIRPEKTLVDDCQQVMVKIFNVKICLDEFSFV